jgi:membrane-anchored protein YejM (alkaline phosphatase superfamily)
LWNTTEPNTSGSNTLTQFTRGQIDTTQHATELFSDEAVRLIKGHDASQPFFMYLSYTSLHAPVQADEVYINSPECKDVS